MSASLDTLAGDIIILQIPTDPPYGVTFGPDLNSNGLVVKSFEKLPTGKFGSIQKHGGIHYDDVLFEINDIPLYNVSHQDALNMLLNSNTLKKTVKFKNKKEYYRNNTRDAVSTLRTQPQDGKNSFLSAVKLSRIAEDLKSKKFVEYEISCQYRVVIQKVHKEYVYQWSIWKRYSDFESLHSSLKKSLGWRIENIEFPSSSMFIMNKLSPDFIDQRREKLKDYWQKLIVLDKITDFTKHHCSLELKDFLQVDANTLYKEISPNSDHIIDEVDDSSSNNPSSSTPSTVTASNAAKRGSVRTNSRRLSTKPINYDNVTNTTASKPITESTTKSIENPHLTNTTTTISSVAAIPISSSTGPVQQQQPPPPPSQQQRSDPRYAVYIKMKSMLPEGAVRQKMEADGFTISEINKFFGTNNDQILPSPPLSRSTPSSSSAMPTSIQSSSTNDNISIIEQTRYAKYSKMKEMRIPDEAVKQKMMTDGFSSDEINQFFNGCKNPSISSSSTTNNVLPVKTAARGNLLDSINALRKN